MAEYPGLGTATGLDADFSSCFVHFEFVFMPILLPLQRKTAEEDSAHIFKTRLYLALMLFRQKLKLQAEKRQQLPK